jgi:phosphate transport system permease protein
MSESYERTLVNEGGSVFERVGAAIVGLGVLTFLFAIASVFGVTSFETRVVGIGLSTLFGVVLSVTGGGVVVLGVSSWLGWVETTPSDTAGVPVGSAFGTLGVVAGGLVGSQLLGSRAAVWLTLAVLVGISMLAVTVLPREDIGSTIPAGGIAIAVGVVLLAGIVGLEWAWNPENLEATFHAPLVVGTMVALSSLLVTWAAAKASSGFGSRGRQSGAYLLMGLNALAMVAVMAALVAFVTLKGASKAFQGVETGLGVGPEVVFGVSLPIDWPFVMNVSQGIYVDIPGILPAIMGTVWIVVGTVLFAVPLGVGAAVFLTEYAEQGRFTRIVEVTTNGLWSTPSIVFGLFGAAFLVPRFGNTNSLLSGILVLGFMLLPLVLITSREALKSVPDEYRDASAALGVSQWQTIRSVVLPAALPGVITGVILGVGRIAGETAPLLLVMAGSPFPSDTPGVFSAFEFTTTPPFVTNDALLTAASALPYQLYATITAGVGAEDAKAFGWGTALVLLLVVLSFYAVGIVLRKYFRGKLHYE